VSSTVSNVSLHFTNKPKTLQHRKKSKESINLIDLYNPNKLDVTSKGSHSEGKILKMLLFHKFN
jgi:hypothetical protein